MNKRRVWADVQLPLNGRYWVLACEPDVCSSRGADVDWQLSIE